MLNKRILFFISNLLSAKKHKPKNSEESDKFQEQINIFYETNSSFSNLKQLIKLSQIFYLVL